MTVDQKRRQKRLAKKKIKRKLKVKEYSRKFNIISHHSRFGILSTLPIHECLVPQRLFEIGIGNVIISRKMLNGNIAAGVFLVDTFCLGVKNAFFTIFPPEKYEMFKHRVEKHDKMLSVQPVYARKLVEESVSYAKNLGFRPHKDYKNASMIFGDIEVDVCPENFEFGKDGMPFFVSGPNDSPSRCKQIIDQLKNSCGEGKFHFMIGGSDIFE